MLMDIALIVVGLIMLVWGGDRFVLGASATARNLGVSPLIVGMVIVGFGTSAPEMFVSIVASFKGNPGIAIGNAIGSNITNIGLVLGLTATLMPLEIHSDTLRREYPLLFVVMFLLALLFMNGYLSRIDGLVLLLCFVLIIYWMIRLALNQRKDEPLAKEFNEEIPNQLPMKLAILWVLVGLIFLPLGSELFVKGAVGIATILGVSDLIIGLTVVAIGTSLPELMASLMGAIKGEHEIAIGNVLGSNIFNLVAVVGFAGVINPAPFCKEVLWRDFPVMLLLTVLLYLMSFGGENNGRIGRKRGTLLLTIYIAYICLLATSQMS